MSKYEMTKWYSSLIKKRVWPHWLPVVLSSAACDCAGCVQMPIPPLLLSARPGVEKEESGTLLAPLSHLEPSVVLHRSPGILCVCFRLVNSRPCVRLERIVSWGLRICGTGTNCSTNCKLTD